MKNLEKKEVIKTSKRKAFYSAIVAPMAIFIVMFIIDKSSSLVAVGVWYFFASTIYAIKKDKQLTAKFYFENLKLLAVLLLPAIVLMSLAIYIGKFV